MANGDWMLASAALSPCARASSALRCGTQGGGRKNGGRKERTRVRAHARGAKRTCVAAHSESYSAPSEKKRFRAATLCTPLLLSSSCEVGGAQGKKAGALASRGAAQRRQAHMPRLRLRDCGRETRTSWCSSSAARWYFFCSKKSATAASFSSRPPPPPNSDKLGGREAYGVEADAGDAIALGGPDDMQTGESGLTKQTVGNRQRCTRPEKKRPRDGHADADDANQPRLGERCSCTLRILHVLLRLRTILAFLAARFEFRAPRGKTNRHS